MNPIFVFRVWQALAGIFTTILIAKFLNHVMQGWYYSFLSVAALYMLLDLGLSVVLIQVAAFEGIKVEWGSGYSCQGPGSQKIIALLRKSVIFYSKLAVVFITIVFPAGYAFFLKRDAQNIVWQWPWFVLCFMTSISLLTTPFLSILEGAGSLDRIYKLRLMQAICGALASWILMAIGAELWAACMASLSSVVIAVTWLIRSNSALVCAVWRARGAEYNWRQEIWPLQWKVAIGTLCGYMVTQINIPILFYIKGPELAGQFGLSLTIANTLGLVCQSWFARHVPLMVQAVAESDWATFDKIFRRDLKESISLFAIGALLVIMGYLAFIDGLIVSRLLPLWPFLGLLVYAFASLLVNAWAIHLRSFRREPLLPLVMLCTALIAPGVVFATQKYSINGMVAVLNAVYLFVLLPGAWVIWRRCNRNWRIVQ